MSKLAAQLRGARESMRGAIAANAPDALMLAGASSLSYGAWLVYPPAGFIVGGLLLLAAGILASKGGD